ncbi:type II toxin-antitoxin system PemK/MazF family toxin [Dactylosporangium siamense]|uniref:Type II toxin-antitoxin system PemK/MazF family toxin n=1 Tax=Dactylosporangium siamense TaxID=685454 RepID=A0A919PGM8_9ACTN|nr:type II toxin-antitoxin system PemK/MazF family toxin [Dactylosporangium siamense]GIG42891.1 hypothetical protein Dsi01nite_009320 [Dactylosporangium siamense]
MRQIRLAQTDKPRPVLVLTRERIRPHMRSVTIAPITTRIRGLLTEVPVGPQNGLDRPSVVSCDNIETVDRDALGPLVGYLLPDQEQALARAITVAFDLET